MAVRAKFRLASYTTRMGYLTSYDENNNRVNQEVEVRTLEFYPVADGSQENKKFFASTPSGKLELGIITPAAWGQFELNKEYYLDITPAEGEKNV